MMYNLLMVCSSLQNLSLVPEQAVFL